MVTVAKKRSMRTGWCIVGQCEGTRPVSPSGKGLKTCDMWEDCPCRCHAEISELCEMAGVERTLRNESLYVSPPNHYWMPTPEWYASLRVAIDGDRANGQADGAAPVNGQQRAREHGFRPTPTGIRARGQLEFDVKKVCDRFDDGSGPVCLPTGFISMQIHPDAPPSVGAIREVLLRWTKYGFATMSMEPLAFTGYTAEGREKGVDVMHTQWERRRRSEKAKADLGYR